MKLLTYVSYFIIPFFVCFVLTLGYATKRNVYEDFLTGAKEGVKTALGLLPVLVGIMTAVRILRTCGLLDLVSALLGQVTRFFGMAPQLVPVAVIRLFSGSAASALVLDLFREYGTDSALGLTASVMMSCTETVFYTMGIYFSAARVTKTRYTLAGALFSTLAGIAASVAVAGWIG